MSPAMPNVVMLVKYGYIEAGSEAQQASFLAKCSLRIEQIFQIFLRAGKHSNQHSEFSR